MSNTSIAEPDLETYERILWADRAARNRAAAALLKRWMAEDPAYDQETGPMIREALDADRESARRLFDA